MFDKISITLVGAGGNKALDPKKVLAPVFDSNSCGCEACADPKDLKIEIPITALIPASEVQKIRPALMHCQALEELEEMRDLLTDHIQDAVKAAVKATIERHQTYVAKQEGEIV